MEQTKIDDLTRRVEELAAQVQDLSNKAEVALHWINTREEQELHKRLIDIRTASFLLRRNEQELFTVFRENGLTEHTRQRRKYYDLREIAEVYGQGVIKAYENFGRSGPRGF